MAHAEPDTAATKELNELAAFGLVMVVQDTGVPKPQYVTDMTSFRSTQAFCDELNIDHGGLRVTWGRYAVTQQKGDKLTVERKTGDEKTMALINDIHECFEGKAQTLQHLNMLLLGGASGVHGYKMCRREYGLYTVPVISRQPKKLDQPAAKRARKE
jgi:hypothetical protein